MIWNIQFKISMLMSFCSEVWGLWQLAGWKNTMLDESIRSIFQFHILVYIKTCIVRKTYNSTDNTNIVRLNIFNLVKTWDLTIVCVSLSGIWHFIYRQKKIITK
jgi:hypothetical protein